MKLYQCLAQHSKILKNFDTSMIVEAQREYVAKGMSPHEAEVLAVEEKLAELAIERRRVEGEIVSAYTEMIGAPAVVEPVAEPKFLPKAERELPDQTKVTADNNEQSAPINAKAESAEPVNKLQQMLQDNKLLPGGEVSGETWKRMLPELDLSHLADGEKYYKDQLLKFSPKEQPIFYSQMARVIDQLMGKAEPAKELAMKVDAWARAGKYKADELQWSGLKDWLQLQDGKVTKAQVAEYLANDGVQVTETVLGSDEETGLSKRRAELENMSTRELENEAADFGIEETSREGIIAAIIEEQRGDNTNMPDVGETKFGNWQLPGGENYRELLLTLPTSPIDEFANNKTFRSSHFDQPNILAHIRFNERTDAEGKRVLFIEEIQSDWAQKGRKEGFKGADDVEIKTLRRQLKKLEDERAEHYWGTDEYRRLDRAQGELARRIDGLANGQPPAPFVNKTEAWTALAMKRMIRYAAENGFDKVAWANGTQQAARYDLSKQVRSIGWMPGRNGVKNVKIDPINHSLIRFSVDADGVVGEDYARSFGHNEYLGKNLSDVVGKDIADKILSSYEGDLSADGLRVGGDGMLGFYDKIVPNVTNDLLKKLGGGRIETTKLSTRDSIRGREQYTYNLVSSFNDGKWAYSVEDDDGNVMFGPTDDEPSARAWLKNNDPVLQTAQPSFTITTAMRESAMRGLPLFSPKFNPNISFPEETRVESVQRTLQDKFNRFKVLRDWALENGAKLTEASDVYMMEALSYGRRATRVEDFRELTFQPIVKELQKAGLSLSQVSDYLHAMHAEERNKAVAKINPKLASGSGMDTATAKAIIAKASPELKAVAAKIQAITKDTLDIKLAAQLISQETYDTLTNAYQNYVPLKGGDEVVVTGTGKGFDINHKMRRALGHTFREEAIIENILRDHETAIALAEKQRVGLSLAQLAIELGDRDVLTVGQPEKRAVLKSGAVQYEVRYDGGTVDVLHNLQDARAAMQNYMKQSGDPKKWAVVKLSSPDRVAYEASPMLQENEARFYINGEAIRIQINDPVLAQAYKNMGVDHLVGVLKIGKAVNTWLSKAYTGYNPEFVAVNMARDFTEGVINLTGDYGVGMMTKVVANYPKALATLARYAATGKTTKDISDYRADGGSTGAAYLSDLERVGEDVKRAYNDYAGVMDTARRDGTVAAARVAGDKTIKALAHYIEVANQASENAMRLATYTALRDAGKSRNEAALAAKDVTLNFNRKGEIGAQAGALYLFFNPAMQGATRSLQTLFYSEHRAQAWALAGSIGLLGFTMAALNADLDPDKWDKTPNYVKGHNLVIPVGSKQLTIPIPYGYGFFLSMGTVLNNLVRGKDKKDSLWLLANAFAESYSPIGNPIGDKPDATGLVQILPTMARIPMEIVTNRSGLGSPIYPKDDEKRPGRPDSSNMFRNTKGTVWDMIAGGLNKATGGNIAQKGWVDVHPDVLKSLWSTATGGTGRFMTDTLQLANLVARGATPDLREMPIVRKFVREENVGDARREFWDAVEEVRKYSDEAATAKAMQRQAYKTGNADMAKEAEMVRAQLAAEQGAMLNLGKMITNYTKQVALKRERADIVMADSSLSLSQRREQVKTIEAEEKEIYNRFMTLFRERKAAKPHP